MSGSALQLVQSPGAPSAFPSTPSAGEPALPGEPRVAGHVVVAIDTDDPLLYSGLHALLTAGRIRVARSEPADDITHDVVLAQCLDAALLERLRGLRTRHGRPVILILSELRLELLGALLDCGVVYVIHRSDATAEVLAGACTGVAAQVSFSARLLRSFVQQASALRHCTEITSEIDREPIVQHRHTPAGALSDREREVLTLVAAGRSTREIAHELCYSERTIKNVLQLLSNRLQLRNRSQLVSYAVRQGWI